MSIKSKNTLTIGLIFIILAAVSFILALLNMPRWLYYAGAICMTLGIVSVAIYYLAAKGSAQQASRNTPTAQNMPPTTASDLLRSAGQSEPQAPLKERQPQQEHAFPPDKDQQA